MAANALDDIINGLIGFQDLKISALSKSIRVNDQIKDLTLGPNRTICEDSAKVTPRRPAAIEKKVGSTERNSLSQQNAPLRKIIVDLERERQEKVEQAIAMRKKLFEEFSNREENAKKQRWVEEQEKMIQKMHQQELLILDALEQYDKNASNQHEQLVQYYQELAEKQKKNAEELEAREKKNALINAIIDCIKKDQTEFRLIFQEIGGLLKSHGTDDVVKVYLPEISTQLTVLPKKMTEIVACCKAGQITENELKKSNEALTTLKSLKEQILKIIAYSEVLKEEAAKQAAAAAVAAATATTISPPTQLTATAAPTVTAQPIKTEPKSEMPKAPQPKTSQMEVVPVTSVLDKYCSRTNLKRLSELQIFLSNYQQGYKQFAEDDTLKQYKFDLKKAVNIPVNTISAVNAKHLLDKYDRLSNLLAGKPVTVGDTQISASKHPQAIRFCMDLLAEKLVLQGDLLISSNPEAAFNYAAMIVALWNDFPDLGKLILAHFYENCPYLVPWYVPRTPDQTTEDYYKSQGYKYIDGVPEKQDKFLKRMTGIMRLYSAIFITKPKRGQNKNPHGMSEAWRWISSVLNLEPRLDVTATMIHVFLETVGFQMQAVYGKEFQKLMRFIKVEYMPMIEKIDSGGPFTRLCVLFDSFASNQVLEPPSGILPSTFW